MTILGYDNFRRAVLSEAMFLGLNIEDIGTHSLRIGGCTEFTKRGVMMLL